MKLSGYLKLGKFELPISIFTNSFKEEGKNQPDFNICAKKEDKWEVLGVLWDNEEKAKK